MNTLEKIQHSADKRGLRFVLIGGLAVIEHGYARFTSDVDLLVSRNDKQQWRDLLSDIGYQLTSERDTFQQYDMRDKASWPVDLMLVGQDTFASLSAAASQTRVRGARVLLVSLEHLIALKLHVLKQAKLHRFLKDFQDVVELVRINHLDLHSTAMRDLFVRYGTEDLYEKLKRAAHD